MIASTFGILVSKSTLWHSLSGTIDMCEHLVVSTHIGCLIGDEKWLQGTNQGICLRQWETFWDDRGQQAYRVNPLFSELCACSELRKQWKFTRYVCCHLALESLLLGLGWATDSVGDTILCTDKTSVWIIFKQMIPRYSDFRIGWTVCP